jgi:ribosomal protein S18 acetylase RimI-like enzyme
LAIIVRTANSHDLAQLASLFDAYRHFYAQTPNLELAKTFISARLNQQNSVIFLAENDANDFEKQLIGFCQIYPSFCSIAAAKIGVLYDLYVDSTARKTGAGRALMLAAHEYAEKIGMLRLDLSTAKDNVKAQALYESLGWVRDDVFYTYTLDMQRLNM